MSGRSSYLISKALRNFMMASVLAAVAAQAATTTDAIVVSHFVGPDAMSAINLCIPVLQIFACIAILFGIGGSVVAAKAIGERDTEAVNHIFTSCVVAIIVVGVVVSAVIYLLCPAICQNITNGNERLYPLTLSYMRPAIIGMTLMMLAMAMENFVKTDGSPKLVTKVVLWATLLNIVLDIVFVKFMGMGISGSAWATNINYLLAVTLCMTYFRSQRSSIHWQFAPQKLMKYVRKSAAQGFPMSINTLLLALSVSFINMIVLKAQGVDGMFIWSVCLQLFMILQMVLAGVCSSVYSIGGVLVGECDMPGFSILNRKAVRFVFISLGAVMAFILISPETFGQIFGSAKLHTDAHIYNAMRIYSLFLIPYAVTAVLRSTHQVLGYMKLSVAESVTQLGLMVLCVWVCSLISPKLLWWGFIVSGIILLTLLFIYSLWRRRASSVELMTLIPASRDGEGMNFSVKMEEAEVRKSLSEISAFLKGLGVESQTYILVKLCCEELMYNIVHYAVEKTPDKHYFDVHITSDENQINVLMKDDGRPFNPIAKPDADDGRLHLGLQLVNSSSTKMNYRYMYDQNMVFLTVDRNKNH